jgi:spore coat protein U-like protein
MRYQALSLIVAALVVLMADARAEARSASRTSAAAAPGVTLPNRCRIRFDPIDFGTYSALDPSPNQASGVVHIRCLPRTTNHARVTFSTGASGQAIDRMMLFGAHDLHYNIYADPAHQLIIGQQISKENALANCKVKAIGIDCPIFGLIPARQEVPAGVYIDVIQVNIEF